MTSPVSPSLTPSRFLYSMIRVRNLEESIAFYRDMLGMRELGRETFASAKFTIVFLGYGTLGTDVALELTYNWGDSAYEHGTAYGNISLAVKDVYALEAALKERGVTILRAAGIVPSSEKGTEYTVAHIADPDGYRVELMQIE